MSEGRLADIGGVLRPVVAQLVLERPVTEVTSAGHLGAEGRRLRDRREHVLGTLH